MHSINKNASPQDLNLPDTLKKRTSSVALTPPHTSKNRFSPLLTLQDTGDIYNTTENDSTQQPQVRPKIPPIYVYNISDYANFHTSLANITLDNFSIVNTKSALKINLNSIDDYRTATKLFDETEIEYHTYQLPENKQLSVVIRNLPVNISEACIYNELQELKFEVVSVTRLQNQFKSPIPIVAVLLSKSSNEIFSLNRLLHCVIIVEPRKPSKDIPQCTNCQRFSHTKKFCHLPSRCVKCAGDHHYSQCQKPLEAPPKCVNCESNRPANYRGCTFYKEILKHKNKNKNSTNPTHSWNYPNTKPNENTQNIHSSKDNTNKQYTYASAYKIQFPGYKIYRADCITQSRAMGGVAILVRNKIKQQLPSLALMYLEAVAVSININNKYITFVSAYQPPSRQMLIADYEKVMSLDNSVIIAGDLNSKHINWGCRVTNPNGSKLQAFIENTPFSISAPNTPTYFPTDINRLPDILDILIIKSVPFACVHEPPIELDSDHIPVKITISSPSLFSRTNNSLIKGKPDWNRFSNHVQSNLKIPTSIPTTQIAEQTAVHLTDVITEAVQTCSNSVPQAIHSPGYLPHSISSLIRRKHLARRTWQNHRNPTDKKILNLLTKKVQVALQNYRVSSYNSYLSNLRPGESNLWKATKRLLNQDINTIPPLHTDAKFVISDQEKCDVFSNMLYNTFSPNHICNPSNEQRVKHTLDLPNYEVQNSINYVTPNEIKQIIKNLPNKKSPGHDKITNLMLKKLPPKGLVFMATLFNSLLRHGYFPSKWKVATIILINKPGKDKSNPDSYRPISLLSSISKLFEKIIHTRLLFYLNAIDLIPKFQFGFRSNHSTVQQLFRITEHINTAFEKHCHTGAVFIDISKAFDKVWHEGLLFKLKSINTPSYLFNIINSFLLNRQFAVKINDNTSNLMPISAGVPQGSKLGPILFNIYVYDIPQSPRTNIALFADDTTIFTESRNIEAVATNRQVHLNTISYWCNKWRIQINASKSIGVIFSLRPYHPPAQLIFNNVNIPWNSSAKYLGLILDKRLTWQPHISSKLQQAYQRLSMLYPVLNKKSSIQKKCSLLIYKQILRPILTYACPVWGICATTHIRKIQIFQNKVLRIIANAPWFIRNVNLHKDLQVQEIVDHIKTSSKNFHTSLLNSSGSLHYNLHVHPPQRRLKRGRPHDLLV
ncbi:hypothetical protein QTP88_027930 [Uroleucon formosanum]